MKKQKFDETVQVREYDFPLGSWVWAKKTKDHAPEVVLYGKAKAGVGYYRMFEPKNCYRKEDFDRIWETELSDPRLAEIKAALKKAGDIMGLTEAERQTLGGLTCSSCTAINGCFWNRVEACFRNKFMNGKHTENGNEHNK